MRGPLAAFVLGLAWLFAPEVRACVDHDGVLRELRAGRWKASRPTSPPWASHRLNPVQEIRWQSDRADCFYHQQRLRDAICFSSEGEEIVSILADPDGRGRRASVRFPLGFLKALGSRANTPLWTDPGMGPDSGENYVLVLDGPESPTVFCLVHGLRGRVHRGLRGTVSPRTELGQLGVTDRTLLEAAWPHAPWGPSPVDTYCFSLLFCTMFPMGLLAYWLAGLRASFAFSRTVTLGVLAAGATIVGLGYLRVGLWWGLAFLGLPAGLSAGILTSAAGVGLVWGLLRCLGWWRISLGPSPAADKQVRASLLAILATRRPVVERLRWVGLILLGVGIPSVSWVAFVWGAVAAGALAESRRQALYGSRQAGTATVTVTGDAGSLWLLALPAVMPFAGWPHASVACGLGVALSAGAFFTLRMDRLLEECLDAGPDKEVTRSVTGAGGPALPSPMPLADAPASGRCVVCGSIEGDARWVRCSACGTPHHAACWSYAGTCGIYGCGRTTAARTDARPPSDRGAACPG